MKRWFALALLGLAGCGFTDPNRPQVSFQPTDRRLVVSDLGTNDRGYWRLVELKYGGKKHVYIQHYDGNNQGFFKVGEYDVTSEIEDIR